MAKQRWLITWLSILVLAGAISAWVTGLSPFQSKAAALVVAEVKTGDIQQSLIVTGTVTRSNQAAVSFPVSGIVTAVMANVGDNVKQGQPLATIDSTTLQAAVVDAQAALAQAQANYENDQDLLNAGTELSAQSFSAGSGGSAAAGSSSGVNAAKGTAAVSKQINTGQLSAAVSKMDEAAKTSNQACQPVIGNQTFRNAAPAAPSSSMSTAASHDPSGSPSAPSPLSGHVRQAVPAGLTATVMTPLAHPATTTASTLQPTIPQLITRTAAMMAAPIVTSSPVHPSVLAPTSGASLATTVPVQPSPTPIANSTVSQQMPPTTVAPTVKATPGVNPQQLGSCLAGLKALQQSQLQALQQINKVSQELQKSAQLSSAKSSSSGSSIRSGSGNGSGNAAGGEPGRSGSNSANLPMKINNDLAAINSAQVQLQQAQDNAASATLVAPIAGVVGANSFSVGVGANAASTITIVGSGASQIVAQIPVTNMAQIKIGQVAKVTPPGLSKQLTGKVTQLGMLPAATTSTTPSYPAIIEVSDSPAALSTGVMAGVEILTGEVKKTLTVPVSAVSFAATGKGSVQVVQKDSAAVARQVTLGIIGQGYVQVLAGLDQSDRVAIADPNQPLAVNQNTNINSITGRGGGGFQRPPGR